MLDRRSSLFKSTQLRLITTQLLLLEPIWLLVLAPTILLPDRFTSVAWHPWLIGMLFLFWPLRFLANGYFLPPTPINWTLWLILLWLPVNIGAAVNKPGAWEAAGYLLVGIVFFVALINWTPTQQYLYWIVSFFFLITLAIALLGPLVIVPDATTPFVLLRVQTILHPLVTRLGETVNPNILAGALVLAVPLQIAFVLSSSWTQQRWVMIGMTLLGFVTLVVLWLMQSRGAIVASIVALAVVLLWRWPKLTYLAPLIFVVVGAGRYWMGSTRFMELITSNNSTGGLNARLEIWTRAYYALHDFIFTGIGLGNFKIVIPVLYPYIVIPADIEIPHAHNLLLQIGVDLGLPGLIAYLGLLINVFVMLLTVLSQRTKLLSETLAVGVLGSLVAMLVHGMVDATTWGTKVAFIPWLLFALVTLLYLSEKPDAKRKASHPIDSLYHQ